MNQVPTAAGGCGYQGGDFLGNDLLACNRAHPGLPRFGVRPLGTSRYGVEE